MKKLIKELKEADKKGAKTPRYLTKSENKKYLKIREASRKKTYSASQG